VHEKTPSTDGEIGPLGRVSERRAPQFMHEDARVMQDSYDNIADKTNELIPRLTQIRKSKKSSE
jgi:hypothetical protein